MALGDDSNPASYIHMVITKTTLVSSASEFPVRLCDSGTHVIVKLSLYCTVVKILRAAWCFVLTEQVQHLIERCMTFGMSMEECMEALAKRADVQPVVTSTGPLNWRTLDSAFPTGRSSNEHACVGSDTVWKELEKENKEFFDQYKQWRLAKGSGSSP
jgi:uncharacterized protein (TIGR01589 family)